MYLIRLIHTVTKYEVLPCEYDAEEDHHEDVGSVPVHALVSGMRVQRYDLIKPWNTKKSWLLIL